MLVEMIITMLKASFLAALLQTIISASAILGLFWGVYVLCIDAKSRKNQNKINECELNFKLNNKRLEVLENIEGLIALPVRNHCINAFKLRWITKPTLNFCTNQNLPNNKKTPKNNVMYQDIFCSLKFEQKLGIISYFKSAITEYNNFLKSAENDYIYNNGTASIETIKLYDIFRKKCEDILVG